MATTTAQVSTARSLIAFGALCQFTGMVLGMIVPAMPFPRLGLGAHINFMSTGIVSLTTGFILYQPNLVQISSGFLRLVMWGNFVSVFVLGSETLNAWWGTIQFLSIAAEQAGATGGTPFQESFMFWAHVIPSLMYIPALGIVVWHLVFGKVVEGKVKL